MAIILIFNLSWCLLAQPKLELANKTGLKDSIKLDTCFTNNGHGVKILSDSLNKQHLFIDDINIEYDMLMGVGDTLFYALPHVTFNQYPSILSIAIELTDHPNILKRYLDMHLHDKH